jgi:branched-subunit amino acid ABC-type transport system permease component
LPAGNLATVFPFVVMLIVLVIRPYGLFGQVRIERI